MTTPLGAGKSVYAGTAPPPQAAGSATVGPAGYTADEYKEIAAAFVAAASAMYPNYMRVVSDSMLRAQMPKILDGLTAAGFRVVAIDRWERAESICANYWRDMAQVKASLGEYGAGATHAKRLQAIILSVRSLIVQIESARR